MILASRIPALTERMRAATIKAAEEQQATTGPVEPDHMPERRKPAAERLAA
jgi:hypothetical protein